MSSQDRLQQHQALNGTTKRSGIGDPKSTGLGATNLLTVSLDQADSTISSESKVRPDPKTTSASHSRQTSASDAFAHGHTDREPTFESQGTDAHVRSRRMINHQRPLRRTNSVREEDELYESAPPRGACEVITPPRGVLTYCNYALLEADALM